MSSEMREFGALDVENLRSLREVVAGTEHWAKVVSLDRAIALLARTEAGADGAAMLVRDVCEMAPADPDAPDTVCIRVSDLTRIAEQYTHPHDASEDAELNAAPVADGAIYQMMATDEDVDEDGNVRPDDPRMWMDHSREEYERLNNHPSVRSRIVYTHPQDASGDAVDWKDEYRFQRAMRYMDNNDELTKQRADEMADEDIRRIEAHAMQAKEAK